MIANQQAKQMDDDALAIIERRAVLAPGEEGLQGVRIISAISVARVSPESRNGSGKRFSPWFVLVAHGTCADFTSQAPSVQ